MSSIGETLKQKIDELDLDRRLNEAVENGEQLLRRAVETAGDLAHDHRDDVDRALDRLTDSIEERTDGRFSDRLGQVRESLDAGLGRLAQRRSDGPPAP
ncbi:MAG: hypothetical protein JWR20_2513 [Marmoricola sp.]|nr:hypothetical protein [Marmoricola sp.]